MFTTARLILTPLRLEDAENVLMLGGDEEVAHYMRFDPLQNREEAEKLIQAYIGGKNRGFAVRRTSDQDFLGIFALKEEEDSRKYSLSLCLKKDNWGRGYATELIGWAKQKGIKLVPGNILSGYVVSENTASRKALEKNGFTCKKILKFDDLPQGLCVYEWTMASGNAAKVNYQKELDRLLWNLQREGRVPTLFLHSCCAPCSSYVLEYLSEYFEITVFYYNPNIYPEEEYRLRVEEQRQFIGKLMPVHPIHLTEGKYDTASFYEIAKGREKEPEGGERCFACYRLRLEEAARYAKEKGFDYFTTTLTISPYKNAQKLNEIGKKLSEQYGVSYLYSDFKKKNGYRRSVELSAEYGLYRQDYCRCIYSKLERERLNEKNPIDGE